MENSSAFAALQVAILGVASTLQVLMLEDNELGALAATLVTPIAQCSALKQLQVLLLLPYYYYYS